MRISDWSSDVCSSDLCGRSIVFAALVRRNACVILLGRPPWHGSSKHWPSAFSVRLCAPASSARVGDGHGPDRHESFDEVHSQEVLTGCGCRRGRQRRRTYRNKPGGCLGISIATLLITHCGKRYAAI